MAEYKVKIKEGETVRAVVAQYNFPASLRESITAYGEAVVWDSALRGFTIDVQNVIRRNATKTPEELQKIVSAWKPGTKLPRVKKTAMEKATGLIASLSPEEIKALLARMSAVSAATPKK